MDEKKDNVTDIKTGKPKEQPAPSPAASDLQNLLNNYGGFMKMQSNKGAIMPSSTDMYVFAQIAEIKRRLKALEMPRERPQGPQESRLVKPV